MFTVKLYQGSHLRILQTKEVNIYKFYKGEINEKSETVELVTDNGSFFIADPMRAKATTEDFYDCAYIENERGSTTQRVTPNMVLA